MTKLEDETQNVGMCSAAENDMRKLVWRKRKKVIHLLLRLDNEISLPCTLGCIIAL